MSTPGIGACCRALWICLAMTACGSTDPTGSGGEGTVVFTTWGEAFIEQEIPPASSEVDGFVDGWTVRYQRFLVNFQNIRVADASGDVAGVMQGSMLFDNVRSGVKPIVTFDAVPARAWPEVSYEIAPVAPETELAPGLSEQDKELMLEGGYSLYLAGTASRDDESKRFAWGFPVSTEYRSCRSAEGGLGIVVTNNTTLEVELTTHGDHPFYDRLQSSPDPVQPTSLRFDAIAEADLDGDDEVTRSELDAMLVDVTRYTTSGDVATLGQFVAFLVRTIGHFRGEGECTVERF